MSTIDSYKHIFVKTIEIPTDYNFVYRSKTREIAVYLLEEVIPNNEESFDGQPGDIIVGGGQGEAPSMRISKDKAIAFFNDEDINFDHYDELFKSFWNPRFSFILGTGLIKLGWNPEEDLDMSIWFAEYTLRELGLLN